MAVWIDVRLAQSDSYIFWHDELSLLLKVSKSFSFSTRVPDIDTCVDPDSHCELFLQAGTGSGI